MLELISGNMLHFLSICVYVHVHLFTFIYYVAFVLFENDLVLVLLFVRIIVFTIHHYMQ